MPELFDVLSLTTNKVSAVTVTSVADPGEEILSLVTPNLPAGVYTIYYSFQVTFSQKNLAAHFGITGDKADASMFAISASDNDELHKNRLYGYPFDWAGGVLTAGLNFYKNGTLTTFIVDFADISIRRVN